MAQKISDVEELNVEGLNLDGSSGYNGLQQNKDRAESAIRSVDQSVRKTTGVSLLHILTIGSIGASIALYLSGKKNLGIFIGLWPPTFQALKAAADGNKRRSEGDYD